MLRCWANLQVSREIVTILFGLIVKLIANLKQWLQDETSISSKAYHFCSAIATISIFTCYIIMTISNLLCAALGSTSNPSLMVEEYARGWIWICTAIDTTVAIFITQA